MSRTKILFSLSGGKTSGKMCKDFIDKNKLIPIAVYASSGKPKYWKHVNDEYEVIFVFSNTSREDNRTLKFVRNMDQHWGFHTVWLESVVIHNERKSSTYRITNYNEAKRDGSVFEEVIKKYGIPNNKFIHCTRELKANPIQSFQRDIGFSEAYTAIGYRFDEPKRVNLIKAKENKQWYPLWEQKITKVDVDNFWKRQPFTLNLLEFEGNCRLCYKKSKRKLLSQILSDPTAMDWICKMEIKYQGDDNHTFFRMGETAAELIAESKEPFVKWTPNPQSSFDFELDEQESCNESCEPFDLNNLNN